MQAIEALPFELGNLKPELGSDSQWDSDKRVRDLESAGVVGEVLFSNGLPFQAIPFVDAAGAAGPGLARHASEIFNRWLSEFCAATPGRRAGMASVSFGDVEQAVADITWAKEHGLAGIMMPALVEGQRFFFDPELDPVWAACQDLDMVICQHGGAGAPAYRPAGYASIMTLALEHSFFSGRSLWQLIYGGVFERFPGLKVVFVETETDWLGRVIQKMDKRLGMGDDWMSFAKFLGRDKGFTKLASEYWAQNCYAGLSPFNATSECSVDEIIGEAGTTNPDGSFALGAERCMFGVDYPHFETLYPDVPQAIAGFVRDPRVTESHARQVLYENVAKVFGFDLDALRPDIERVGFTTEDVLGAVPA